MPLNASWTKSKQPCKTGIHRRKTCRPIWKEIRICQANDPEQAMRFYMTRRTCLKRMSMALWREEPRIKETRPSPISRNRIVSCAQSRRAKSKNVARKGLIRLQIWRAAERRILLLQYRTCRSKTAIIQASLGVKTASTLPTLLAASLANSNFRNLSLSKAQTCWQMQAWPRI